MLKTLLVLLNKLNSRKKNNKMNYLFFKSAVYNDVQNKSISFNNYKSYYYYHYHILVPNLSF